MTFASGHYEKKRVRTTKILPMEIGHPLGAEPTLCRPVPGRSNRNGSEEVGKENRIIIPGQKGNKTSEGPAVFLPIFDWQARDRFG